MHHNQDRWRPTVGVNGNPSARLKAARSMPHWMQQTRGGVLPPAPPPDHNDPDYEVIDFPNQAYSNAPIIRDNRGKRCDLCGSSAPSVHCVQCNQQNFCMSCDDMYHRHPKRQTHVRKALDSRGRVRQEESTIRPPLPPKGEPTPAPVPPPRRNRRPLLPNNAAPTPPPHLDQSMMGGKMREAGIFGTLQRGVPGRPLPPTPASPMLRDRSQSIPHGPMDFQDDRQAIFGRDPMFPEWDMDRSISHRTGSFTALNMMPPHHHSPAHFNHMAQAHSMAQLNCPSCHHHGGGMNHHHGGGMMWGPGWGGGGGGGGYPTGTWHPMTSQHMGGSRGSSRRLRRDEMSSSDDEDSDLEHDRRSRNRTLTRRASLAEGINRRYDDETLSVRGSRRRRPDEDTLSMRGGRKHDFDDTHSLRGGRKHDFDDARSLRGGKKDVDDMRRRNDVEGFHSLRPGRKSDTHRRIEDDNMSFKSGRSSKLPDSGYNDTLSSRDFEDTLRRRRSDADETLSVRSSRSKVEEAINNRISRSNSLAVKKNDRAPDLRRQSSPLINHRLEVPTSGEESEDERSSKSPRITSPQLELPDMNGIKSDEEERPLGPIPTSEWACEHCTFVNEPGTRVCAVCCKTTTVPVPLKKSPPPYSKINLNEKLKNLTMTESDTVKKKKAEPVSQKKTGENSVENKTLSSKGTSPPPREISTQTYDLLPRDKKTSASSGTDWAPPQRSYSRQSLVSDSQSIPLSPPRSRSPETDTLSQADSHILSQVSSERRRGSEPVSTSRMRIGRAGSQPPEYLSTLVQKQVKQGLEMVKLLREAEEHQFSADDLAVALQHCGDGDPVAWLLENWRNMIDTVVTLATNYGHERKENTIGTISASEARDALRLHNGNVWAAVTECVESRQKKYSDLLSRGNFSREDIVTVLTANHGNLEAAYTELSKSQLKPFLMRIWGPPQGAENESGNVPKAHGAGVGTTGQGNKEQFSEVSDSKDINHRVESWLTEHVHVPPRRLLSSKSMVDVTSSQTSTYSDHTNHTTSALDRKSSDVHRYLTHVFIANDQSLELNNQSRYSSMLNLSTAVPNQPAFLNQVKSQNMYTSVENLTRMPSSDKRMSYGGENFPQKDELSSFIQAMIAWEKNMSTDFETKSEMQYSPNRARQTRDSRSQMGDTRRSEYSDLDDENLDLDDEDMTLMQPKMSQQDAFQNARANNRTQDRKPRNKRFQKHLEHHRAKAFSKSKSTSDITSEVGREEPKTLKSVLKRSDSVAPMTPIIHRQYDSFDNEESDLDVYVEKAQKQPEVNLSSTKPSTEESESESSISVNRSEEVKIEQMPPTNKDDNRASSAQSESEQSSSLSSSPERSPSPKIPETPKSKSKKRKPVPKVQDKSPPKSKATTPKASIPEVKQTKNSPKTSPPPADQSKRKRRNTKSTSSKDSDIKLSSNKESDEASNTLENKQSRNEKVQKKQTKNKQKTTTKDVVITKNQAPKDNKSSNLRKSVNGNKVNCSSTKTEKKTDPEPVIQNKSKLVNKMSPKEIMKNQAKASAPRGKKNSLPKKQVVASVPVTQVDGSSDKDQSASEEGDEILQVEVKQPTNEVQGTPESDGSESSNDSVEDNSNDVAAMAPVVSPEVSDEEEINSDGAEDEEQVDASLNIHQPDFKTTEQVHLLNKVDPNVPVDYFSDEDSDTGSIDIAGDSLQIAQQVVDLVASIPFMDSEEETSISKSELIENIIKAAIMKKRELDNVPVENNLSSDEEPEDTEEFVTVAESVSQNVQAKVTEVKTVQLSDKVNAAETACVQQVPEPILNNVKMVAPNIASSEGASATQPVESTKVENLPLEKSPSVQQKATAEAAVQPPKAEPTETKEATVSASTKQTKTPNASSKAAKAKQQKGQRFKKTKPDGRKTPVPESENLPEALDEQAPASQEELINVVVPEVNIVEPVQDRIQTDNPEVLVQKIQQAGPSSADDSNDTVQVTIKIKRNTPSPIQAESSVNSSTTVSKPTEGLIGNTLLGTPDSSEIVEKEQPTENSAKLPQQPSTSSQVTGGLVPKTQMTRSTDESILSPFPADNSEANSDRGISPIPTDSEKEVTQQHDSLEQPSTSKVKPMETLPKIDEEPLDQKLELINILKESLSKDAVIDKLVTTLFASVLQEPKPEMIEALGPFIQGKQPVAQANSKRPSISSEPDNANDLEFYEAQDTGVENEAQKLLEPNEIILEEIVQQPTVENEAAAIRIDHEKDQLPSPPLTGKQKFERDVRRCLAEGLVKTYEQAELAVQLMDMDFDEETSIIAANECGSLQSALAFLQQECQLCAAKCTMKQMVSMLECEHNCCHECAQNYFTLQITERSVPDCVCPFCKAPDVSSLDQDHAQNYFSNLDILLKGILEERVHELFQRKLRDWTLMQDPNFKWCAKCSSGFIANPRQKRLTCPDCRNVTCANCGKHWEKQHEGLSCDAYAKWLEIHDPEHQLARHMDEHGITCPKCKARYSLARGGCMHLTCSHCKHEFCSGCAKPFLMGDKCSVSEYCQKLGLHSHHPRNCLFYLRDKEPNELQKLLEDNGINYKREDEDMGNRCRIQLLKETEDGLVDAICGHPIENNGLCRTHLIEYLVKIIVQQKLDPAVIMDLTEAVQEIKRRGKVPPKREDNTTDANYLALCIKMVQEEIPLE